ncbi:partial Hemolysin, chromosomal, partial [Burkholderiaceae bacterium]
TTNEDTALTIAPATLLANDSDPENNPLSFVSVQGAVNGSVAMSAGNIVFTPQANYSGPASFTYTVSDGQGGTSTGTVSVNVVAVADAPALSAPTHLYSLNAGSASISTASGTNQNNIEAALGLPAGTLDDFDPPAGSGTNDPGTVNVNNGRYTSYSLSLDAGSQANFNWQFFNGEDMASEINSGFNDMLILAITDPAGVQQFVQVTSSEQTGPNTNGGTVDATGVYSFVAGTAGQYTFHWIVANGGDATKNSSATIASPTVNVGATSHGSPIAFPINAGLADTDGSETLSVSVSGVPAGAAFSAGTDQGGGVWTFTAAELGGLQLLPASGFTGTLNLTVTGTSTEASNGATASASQSVTIQVGTTTASQMGTQNAETLNGTSGSDQLRGYGGNDTLNGSGGNDLLHGDAGNDTLNGGNGNDILYGGSGNDTLTGGSSADVFAWTLADSGAAGSPAVDVITDFNNATAAAGGDQLDLRDLLQGENLGGGTGNLGNYLHFSLSGGNTTIAISSNGGFSGGYSASAVDQTIVLQSVDLTSGGVLTDQQIIQDLLQKSKLVVDVGP